MRITIFIFGMLFIKGLYSNEFSSNIEKISFFIKKYENALTICENKRSIKKAIDPDDLNILKSFERDVLSAFIVYKSEVLSKACIINNGGPSIDVIYSLRSNARYNERVIIDNFIKLISTPSLSSDFLNYTNIPEHEKTILNSIDYFNEPFSLSYIANQIVGN